MNFRFGFTADKATFKAALAAEQALFKNPLPAPVNDLIALAFAALPDSWQATVDCSGSVEFDGLTPGPTMLMLRVTPTKKST